MYLLGTVLQSGFTLGSGLSRNSFEMIFFRALAGVASACCLPSAVSLITTYFPEGRQRNIAFSAMGAGQPLGFAIGLTMGGAVSDKIGWRSCFHISAGINTLLVLLSILGLPQIERDSSLSFERLRKEVDWIGAFLLSSALALISYVFA
jgi:MFS family permease